MPEVLLKSSPGRLEERVSFCREALSVMLRMGCQSMPAEAPSRSTLKLAEAIEAGALGFSTSRTIGHRSLWGAPVPGTFAADEELLAIARAMGLSDKTVSNHQTLVRQKLGVGNARDHRGCVNRPDPRGQSQAAAVVCREG